MKKSVRILNISPKAQLALTDSNVDAYPTILRTGDERTLGNDASIFDDFKAQMFVKQDVIMPYNANKDWVDQSGFLTGTITLNKEITPQSQFLTRYTDYSYNPYNEARNPSSFYGSGSIRNQGFDETRYQGFSSEISSKIAIPVDISISSDVVVGIIGNGKDDKTTSPFVYYNFQNKTWDSIGITDPATGKSTNYYHLMDASYKNNPMTGDTWLGAKENAQPLLKQFTSSPGIGTLLTTGIPLNQKLIDFGYHKIGYPTSFFDAPNSKRYHATSAQSLKLSDYIKHPFILEKIQILLPVMGTKYHGSVITGNARGSGRDIDNHVFFLYRQNRSSVPVDSATDVSSSMRSLIGNESFCFYNKRAMPLLGGLNYLGPQHENGFVFDYNVTLTSIGTFNSPRFMLDMQFTPKTYEQQYTAASTIGLISNTITNGYIQNYWDGGQRSADNDTDDINSFPTLPRAIRTIQARGNNQFLFTTTSNPGRPDKIHTFDPRAQRSSTFSTSFSKPLALSAGSYFDEDVTSTDLSYRKNLYLLLPEDELIFGIDAGVFPTYLQDTTVTTVGSAPNYDLPTGYQDNIAAIKNVGIPPSDTTSRLTILAGEAKVILYGSLVKDGIEKLVGINQKLTSPAIHEDIHQIITDQFQVNETKLFSGSYIGNIVTGNMTAGSGSRTLVSSLSNTLSRFVTLTNFSSVLSGSIEPVGFETRETPRFPTSRFRYDKFGQFRDMLEQRIDSKGYEFKYTSNALPIPNFTRTFGISQIASPVIVSFVSQSSTINVDPASTRSGNLSFECTSSFPYFEDRSVVNRSDIIFGTNPPFEVQTVILDKPSSLLSTT